MMTICVSLSELFHGHSAIQDNTATAKSSAKPLEPSVLLDRMHIK